MAKKVLAQDKEAAFFGPVEKPTKNKILAQTKLRTHEPLDWEKDKEALAAYVEKVN